MLRPVLGDAALYEAVRARGGLVNTIYRISTGKGGIVYGLRVYAEGGAAPETERRLLYKLAETLPVPKVLFAASSGQHCAHSYLVYEWLEGITLNEWRRQSSRESLLTLAEPLGRLLARIARAPSPADCLSRRIRIAPMLELAEEQLREGMARRRLGDVLAQELLDCLSRSSSVLRALDDAGALVHGDFGGRNILVKAGESGAPEISGVIDWEEAAIGSPLWDAGSLFRYPLRYSEEFRTLFASGYEAGGAKLPRDWWTLARMIDSVRLVSILNEERELPIVFAECVELIQAIVADRRRAGA